MKKRIATLSLALALTVSLCAPVQAAENSFIDVPADHWAADAITEMANKGVMAGIGNGKFAPEQTISAAEFAAMVVRYFYADEVNEGGEKWYSPYWAVLSNHCTLSDGKKVPLPPDPYRLLDYTIELVPWNPEAPINRYNVAMIAQTVMYDKGINLKSLPWEQEGKSIPDWEAIRQTKYYSAVSSCFATGILSGIDDKGTFHGEGLLTRAEAAVILSRLIAKDSEHYGVPANITETVYIPTEADYQLGGPCRYVDGTLTAQVTYGGEDGTAKFKTNGAQRVRITCSESTQVPSTFTLYNGKGDYVGGAFQNPIGVYEYTCAGEEELVLYMKHEYNSYLPDGQEGAPRNMMFPKIELLTTRLDDAIPVNALELTDSNTKVRMGEFKGDAFVLLCDGMTASGSSISFTNDGYTTLTFTVTSYDRIHHVSVVGVDGIEGDGKLFDHLETGVPTTFTVDISDIRAVQLQVRSGATSDAIVSNVYLTK